MLCWRANRPQGSQLTDYVHMLELGLVQPVGMQLYYMSIDDPNSIQMIGPFNGTSFAPSFLPVIAFKFSRFLFFDCFLSWQDDSGLIFSSNMHDPEGGSFQLYTVNLDGSNLRQITTEAEWGEWPSGCNLITTQNGCLFYRRFQCFSNVSTRFVCIFCLILVKKVWRCWQGVKKKEKETVPFCSLMLFFFLFFFFFKENPCLVLFSRSYFSWRNQRVHGKSFFHLKTKEKSRSIFFFRSFFFFTAMPRCYIQQRDTSATFQRMKTRRIYSL